MKISIINIERNSFLAHNHRWYALKRKARLAPAPRIFNSKGAAVIYAAKMCGLRPSQAHFVRPRDVAVLQIVPKSIMFRRTPGTCVGRR